MVKDKTRPRTRNEQEIAGYRDVLNTIHESHDHIPPKSAIILQLHRDLYKFESYNIGGKYKIADNVIEEEDSQGIKKIRFKPVPAWETPEAMEELCRAFEEAMATGEIDPLLLIPMFILDFLCIHPFNDGNGRMSRLLTLLLLYRSGYIVGKYISIERMIENSKELFEEINKEIEESQKKREELNQKHKAFLKKREDLATHMAELDKESFRLTSKKEGYEEALEKQINYMWEEYELTYNHALEIRDESLTDPAEMRRRIQELKTEIRKLGSVNVNAIEDFKNLSERYEFMKTQHDDLVEAEATLKKIIEELDEAMRKQFTEQFAKISQEFNQVFKQLFGGGKGTLELMDDEDVLEAGIRIIAQPPGKKLQNMMQLSGGEKALTAISLLFAIQNLKPSPFCLLDEIEAALDDSNVTRFAQYLHKLTKNTQFIVITHRRGTMTAADRLYGITMQEKGVSTLVSVDLLEDELTK